MRPNGLSLEVSGSDAPGLNSNGSNFDLEWPDNKLFDNGLQSAGANGIEKFVHNRFFCQSVGKVFLRTDKPDVVYVKTSISLSYTCEFDEDALLTNIRRLGDDVKQRFRVGKDG
jgi:hypothetical protein